MLPAGPWLKHGGGIVWQAVPEKKPIPKLRLLTILVLSVFIVSWAIAEWGDDTNPFVAMAAMGVCGLIVPFSLIASLVFSLRKQWIDLGIVLGGSALYLVISGQFFLNFSSLGASSPGEIRTMTFNVEHGWQSVERIANSIRKNGIECFSLQECGLGEDAEAINALKALMPEYHFFSDGSRTCGTKLKVVRERSLKLDKNQWGWTMIELVVEKDGQRLRMLNVHSPSYLPEATFRRPFPEWFSRFGEVASEQTELIKTELDMIQIGNMPTILCGDFNMAPVGSRNRLLAARGEDAFARSGIGPGWTSPSRFSLRRIDQIWTFNGARAIRSFVLDPRGSDHAAVVADISVR